LEGLATPDPQHRSNRLAFPRRLIRRLLSKGQAVLVVVLEAELAVPTQFQTGPQAGFRFWQICLVRLEELVQAETAARARPRRRRQSVGLVVEVAHHLRSAQPVLAELAGAHLEVEVGGHL
jgi:hypothetical protein